MYYLFRKHLAQWSRNMSWIQMILMGATVSASCHILGGVPGMSLVTRWTRWIPHSQMRPEKLQVRPASQDVIFVSGTQFVWQTIFTSAKISITHIAWQRRQGSRHIILFRIKAPQEGSRQIRISEGTYPRFGSRGRIASIRSEIPGTDKSKLMLSRWCLQLQEWCGRGYRRSQKWYANRRGELKRKWYRFLFH